ncbi:MAG: hypothetical protein U0359_01300 [Byssovorax sp.]
MSAIDPRLDPVLASERRSGRGVAVFALALLLIAGTLVYAGLEREQHDMSRDAITAVMFLVFFLPGLWLLRVWQRGPEATAIVKLLTVNRHLIKEWDFEYVSTNGGSTQTRLLFFLHTGRFLSVDLAPGEAKGVMEYVAETAPRRQR